MKPKHLTIAGVVLLLLTLVVQYVPRPDIDVPFVTPTKHPDSWIVMVEESAERTEAGVKFVADADYHADLANRGLKWKIYDDDSTDATQARGIAKTLPALLIVSKDQAILANEPWPASVEKLDEIVKRSTGL